MIKYFASLVISMVCFSAIGAAAIDTKNKPIEIVVPFSPGGAATNSAQILANILRNQGHQVIVTNKPGNNGIIAANYVASSAPTGHTLFLGSLSTIVGNVAFKKDQSGMEYNENSFVPVILTNKAAMGLIVASTSGIKNYDDFKKFVKQNPKQFNIGTYNVTFGHVFKEWAKQQGLPEPTIILYKGSAGIVIDVANGNLFSAFDNIGWGTPAMPLLEDNKLFMIGTLDNSASKKVKSINPHATDFSSQGKIKFSVWNGLFAPASTPKNIIESINKAIDSALLDPKHRESISSMEGLGGSPEEITSLIRKDFVMFKKLANDPK